LRRLGENRLSDEELDVLTPMLLAEPVEPPGWFIIRAARIPVSQASQQREPARGPNLLTRLVASLSFDSMLQPRLVGVRGATVDRRLIYKVGSLTAYLMVREGDEGRVTISGQLTPNDIAKHFRVEVQAEDGRGLPAPLASNALGYFVLRNVERGAFTLLIRGQGEEFELRTPAL
jgi:hypothetical protein